MYFLKDDLSLLKKMNEDANNQIDIYKPGQYWKGKAKLSFNQIKKYGLKDFRGSSNSIGMSFSDLIFIDTRNKYDKNIKTLFFKFLSKKLFPFNMLFNRQVSLTRNFANQMLTYKRENVLSNPRTLDLLSKYKIPFSMLGGCLDYIEFKEEKISIFYLSLLDQLDNAMENIDIHNAKSFFEIGGGFGINVHLILENFKNIRKIIYLDIPPNLYTGTQYLKAFYGDAVKDYNQTRHLDEISFKNNDDLEILAIAPWQIEKINAKLDIFYNSHSFVEMPKFIVENYAKYLRKSIGFENSSIILISYDGFDLNTTFDPDILPKFFDSKQFRKYAYPSLINPNRNNFFYISK